VLLVYRIMSCHDEKCEVLGCTCAVISSVEEMPLNLLDTPVRY